LRAELKKQIKEDEFASGLERAARWAGAHRDEVRVTAIVALALVLGIGGFTAWQSRRSREAERAFSEAQELFHAPVLAALPQGAERPPEPVFPTFAEKYRKALAAFDGVERRFGSHPLALRARYYGALCRMETGDVTGAEKLLAEIAARRDARDLTPALARLALAEVQRRAGQVDKAVDTYTQIAADASYPLPRDAALMGLAATLEEARRWPAARDSYKRLLEEFPLSAYAAEARRRAEHLATTEG